jgi:amino acid transporter
MADFRRIILGRRLASDETEERRLGAGAAFAAFGSNALSSVAYGTQEIVASLSASGVVLVAGTVAVARFALPVALAVLALLGLLAFSYRQTIQEYPGNEGAYMVAKDNLGEVAAQAAGASLLMDYILTVAVSVSAAIAAVTSALPALRGGNVVLALLVIALIALGNLRGMKGSAVLSLVPTFGFVICIGLLMAVGFGRWALGQDITVHEVQAAAHHAPRLAGLALLWILMRSFSGGCSALTGVESVSNGVKSFKEPSGREAAGVLTTIVVLLGAMFLGLTALAHHCHPAYQHNAAFVQETLLSTLSRHILGRGGVVSGIGRLFYVLVQLFTFAILLVAANAAYSDFPRLAALHAKDGFLPQQFTSQGDRLVFSNGIISLSAVACVLVILFQANTDLLLPLYALGVFLGLTISQWALVHHWRRKRGKGWKWKAMVSGTGAIVSAAVTFDITLTKFAGGAWIVTLLLPLSVAIFFNIHRHYIRVKSKLAASRTDAFLPSKHHAIVLVSGIHKGVVQALAYGRLISGNRVEALTVDEGSDGFHESANMQKLRADWAYYGMGVPLRSVPSPYRRIVEPVLDEVDRFRLAEPEVCLTVILPEFVTPKWWQRLLHNQMAFRIKAGLMLKPGVIVTSVRMHLPD